MDLKRLHYFSGITITIFVGLHLFNHSYSIFGANSHIELMHNLRVLYRNRIAEIILSSAISIQIGSGIKLFFTKRKTALNFFGKLQIWSGLYLAFFFIIHLSAVISGRLILKLDTNFYFGVAGLNTFPLNLFFIPYYSLAIISFFGHIAAIHSVKKKNKILGIKPATQAFIILYIGLFFTFIILYGLTNKFVGVEIPETYNTIIGK